jgi:exopolyphosphatase / guanosine-5'-triphosphate,3'-diphosphate pyrophosphatase
LLPPTTERRLVVDIGGGSTELIVGEGHTAHAAESFKLGCVSHTRRFFADGVLNESTLRQAEIAAAAELEEARQQFGRHAGQNWSIAYGSSGTISALADIARAMGLTEGVITTDSLAAIRQALITAGHLDKVQLPGLKPDRLAVLAGGYAVLAGVYKVLDVGTMRPAKGALRHGVMFDLFGRRELIDTRDATVESMVDRFLVDRPQAERVADLSLRLFRQLQGGSRKLGEPEKMLIRAAMLHEVGFVISHGDYHKHGAYILEHSDLSGFSTDDQVATARLVLGQRGNLRKIIDTLSDETIRHQVMALRLAVLLLHGRLPGKRITMSALVQRGAYRLQSTQAWLKAHPLTQHLLNEEVEHWRRAGYRVELEGNP